VSALAILIPQRGYATEQATSNNSSQNYPPPGFNAEQAKKPISQDQTTQSQSTAGKTQPTETQSAVSKSSAGVVSKTNPEDQKLAEKKSAKKLTLGQKVKKELQHYWDGTKLLATEVKISSRLALKMAGGYELSRREHRQVCLRHPSYVDNLYYLANLGFVYSSNVLQRIWDAWFRFRCSSSFHLPNSCSPLP
jgi:LETM1 and EF-hand domain-containing protein 1